MDLNLNKKLIFLTLLTVIIISFTVTSVSANYQGTLKVDNGRTIFAVGEAIDVTANISHNGVPINSGEAEFFSRHNSQNSPTIKANFNNGIVQGRLIINQVGKHDLFMITRVNGVYETSPLTIEVQKPVATNIRLDPSNPTTGTVGDTLNLKSIVTDQFGNRLSNAAVEFFIDGSKVGTQNTNNNGEVTYRYKANATGSYTFMAKISNGKYDTQPITISAKGTTGGGSSGGSHGNLGSIPTKINITAPTIYNGQATNIRIVVTGYDNKYIANQKVRIALNGKTYTKVTNSKGTIVLRVTGLKTGKYKVTAKYYGNTTYRESNSSKVQTVRAATSKLADLKITKVKRSGDYYSITIKNQGKARSSKYKLALFCGCREYVKTTVLNSLAVGKSVTKVIKYYPYAKTKTHNKYVYVNYNKYAAESNYKNNLVKLGRLVK